MPLFLKIHPNHLITGINSQHVPRGYAQNDLRGNNFTPK